MKVCRRCQHRFASTSWTCPECGAEPQFAGDVPVISPQLLQEHELHAGQSWVLDKVQESNFWFRARRVLIADLVGRFSPNGRSLLEVGCGTGFVLEGLNARFPRARLAGSDLSLEALSYARRRLGVQIELMQMDVREIPYADEFDVVAACDVLEHIEEDVTAIGELKRALKPGGFLVVTVPQHPGMWSEMDELAGHKRRYRTSELASKLLAADLEIVLDTSFVTLLFPAMAAQRRWKARRKDYDPVVEFTLPAWLDRAFESLLHVERLAIRAGARLPFGGSRVVVARRRLSGNPVAS